jgi:(5-formylfuran-3-yl)methyl phosphate synthase
MTLMLATVTGPEEAEIAIAAGADIIDFANPDGSPKAPDIEKLGELVRGVGGRRRVSASVGTLPADPRRAIELVRSVARPVSIPSSFRCRRSTSRCWP